MVEMVRNVATYSFRQLPAGLIVFRTELTSYRLQSEIDVETNST
jgi:hypothetical protein